MPLQNVMTIGTLRFFKDVIHQYCARSLWKIRRCQHTCDQLGPKAGTLMVPLEENRPSRAA